MKAMILSTPAEISCRNLLWPPQHRRDRQRGHVKTMKECRSTRSQYSRRSPRPGHRRSDNGRQSTDRSCPCRWYQRPSVRTGSTARKLKAAAQMTAWCGFSTRVETIVAIELAASWKPFMKSNSSATITRVMITPRLICRLSMDQTIRSFQGRSPRPCQTHPCSGLKQTREFRRFP